MSEAEFIFRSEYLPISYHRRRYKDPRLCYKLVARASFCQHWPFRLQGYEIEYILLGDYRDHCRSLWSLWLRVRVRRGNNTMRLAWLSCQPHGTWIWLYAFRVTNLNKQSSALRESNDRETWWIPRLYYKSCISSYWFQVVQSQTITRYQGTGLDEDLIARVRINQNNPVYAEAESPSR